MKKEINPVVVVAAIVVVVALVGLLLYKGTGKKKVYAAQVAPPADAIQEFNDRLGGFTGAGTSTTPATPNVDLK